MKDAEIETEFYRFFQNSPDVTCLLEEGVITRINPAFEKSLGYAPEEVISRRWLDYIHPEDRGKAEECMASVLSGGIPMRFEGRFARARGGELRLEWSVWGDQSAPFVIATARKKAETSSRKSEAGLEETQRVAHIGSFSRDLVTGEDDWSDEMFRILGHGPNEIEPDFDLIVNALDETSGHLFQEDLARLLETGWPVDSYFRFRRPQGESRYGHAWMRIEADASNRPVKLIGAVQDITRQKTVEEKLRALTSELAVTESRERRRIANDLHDQVGQMLFLAKMKLDALKQMADDPGVAELTGQAAGLIDQAMKDIRSLIMEISPPVLRMLGLESAMLELADKLHGNHGIPVEIKDDLQPKPLSEDMKDLVFRAVREILLNAVKHARTDSISINISRENSSIRIDVEDFGRGFDAAKALNEMETPMGYGLLSIRERLHPLGGRLAIDSAPGRGTRVTLTAPLHHPARGGARTGEG